MLPTDWTTPHAVHLELSKGLESDAEDVYLGRRGPDRPGAWAAGRGAPACPPNPGTARRRFRDPRTTGTTTVASETTTSTRLGHKCQQFLYNK